MGIKKAYDDFAKRKRALDKKVEELRKFLPATRGGRPPILRYDPGTRPFKPLPKIKVFNERPFFDGEEVRWIPTAPHPNARPQQEMITVTIEDDMREIFENVDEFAAQELAEEIYQVAEQTQNQEMENALAKIEARRPREFQPRSRSRQFSRLNLMPAPKKKRKVSAYSREFGIQLKKLKKLHPRTKIQNLMKKAHRRTRAAMKKK